MSVINVRRIRKYLEDNLTSLIDVSDLVNAGRKDEEIQQSKLTRALAAFAIMINGNVSLTEAALSITDGYQDMGLDAIYYDKTQKILYLVQAKWSDSGNKTILLGDTHKFLEGFEKIIYHDFNVANEKIIKKEKDIEEAVYDASTHIKLIIIYTGHQELPNESRDKITRKLQEINDTSDIASFDVLKQSDIYKIIAQGLDHNPINLDVVIKDWVQLKEPFKSYYGRISAQDVVQWRQEYYPKIFTPNIRVYLGNTDINQGIIETLKNEPEHFWYYNNGITALCRSINKKPIGGYSRDHGIFECKDFQIINGAQTIGSVYEAFRLDSSNTDRATIPIRIISLEDCPEDFSKKVTKYNNTQNKIDKRDFVALDPEQERIKNELYFYKVMYVYRSGEVIPQNQEGFTLEDATVALACYQEDLSLSIRAKDKIGTLWDDIQERPYKLLFNGRTNSEQLLNLVKIMRIVESILLEEKDNDKNTHENRRRLLCINASKIILHLIFQELKEGLKQPDYKITDELNTQIHKKVTYYLDEILKVTNSLYPNSYPANIFRNKAKCSDICEAILGNSSECR
jgi:hypothetical protein